MKIVKSYHLGYLMCKVFDVILKLLNCRSSCIDRISRCHISFHRPKIVFLLVDVKSSPWIKLEKEKKKRVTSVSGDWVLIWHKKLFRFSVLNRWNMVITLDHDLPNEDELTVPELKLSGPALRAGAFHLGKYCQDTFNVRIFCCCLLFLFNHRFGSEFNSIEWCTIIVWVLEFFFINFSW